MTIKELRTFTDNLGEFAAMPNGIELLKNTILHLAISGQLVPQDPAEGTGEELYREIQTEKARLVAEGRLKKQKELPPIRDEEIPFEIPASWKWVRVKEVTHDLGQQIPKSEFSYIDTGAIDSSKGEIVAPKILQSKEAPSRARKNVVAGTVIYSTVRPYLKNIAIVGDNDHLQIASTAFEVLHPLSGLNPYYLYLYLRSETFSKFAVKHSVGISYPAISSSQFEKSVIPLPPLVEQERVIKRVREYFTKIDRLAAEQKLLQQTRAKLVSSSFSQATPTHNNFVLNHLTELVKSSDDAKQCEKYLLSLAISGQLVPQDPAEGTGEELYREIQTEKARLVAEGRLKKQKELPPIREEEIPFEIPKTWMWVRLGDVVGIKIGKTPSRSNATFWNGSTPWVSIADLKMGETISSTKEKITDNALREIFSDSLAPAGTLLFSFKLTIGKMSILGMDAQHNEAIASIITTRTLLRDFLYYYLRAKDFSHLTAGAIKGATLNSTSLAHIEVALPPLVEQERIVNKLRSLTSKLEAINRY